MQKGPDTPIIFIHVDDLKLCPTPQGGQCTPGSTTAKSLCASTVAVRPGSHIGDSDSSPSVMVSTWKNCSSSPNNSEIRLQLDNPIDLDGHILSPFAVRDFTYQDCHFHSVAHLMCFRYAVLNDLKLFATSVRQWSRHLSDFPMDRFKTHDWQVQCQSVLKEIYGHLCIIDVAVKNALTDSGPRPFVLQCYTQQGGFCDPVNVHRTIVNNALIETRVDLVAGRLTTAEVLQPTAKSGGLRNAAC